MAENTVDPAATEDSGLDLETDPSEETKNTDPVEGPVPYDRFRAVTHENRDLKEERDTIASERDALQAKYDELLSGGRTETPKAEDRGLENPPSNLSEREQAAWLVERDAERYLEKKLGMGLDDVAKLLNSIPQAANYATERQWETLCEKHGLDPQDQTTREVAAGLFHVHGEKADPNKVMERVSGILRKGKEPPSPRRAESDGVTTVMSGENFMPSNVEEASKAAKEGKRVPYIPTSEILRRKDKERAKG